jgi:hypothetical protein
MDGSSSREVQPARDDCFDVDQRARSNKIRRAIQSERSGQRQKRGLHARLVTSGLADRSAPHPDFAFGQYQDQCPSRSEGWKFTGFPLSVLSRRSVAAVSKRGSP